MGPQPFANKHPADLTSDDIKNINRLLKDPPIGAFRNWADYLLTFLTPDQAVEALRKAPKKLWPRLAASITLSGALVARDEPPYEEYEHLMDEWEAEGKFASREQEYIDTHMGPAYVTSLGLLFGAMTDDERVAAIDTCDPKRAGLVSSLVSFLTEHRPDLLLALLPTIEKRTGYGAVEALLKTNLPECHETAFRISLGLTDLFPRFLCFRALHAVSAERHQAETFSAAQMSLEGSDHTNNHHVAAEWLCRFGGEMGVSLVVHYLKTRDTIWLSSVAYFSIQVLGDRASPIMEAARQAGVLKDEEFPE